MIRATFFTLGKKVTTDSLYQYDVNQILEITGANLTTPPPVHFGNKANDEALVVQSEIVDGVIRAAIPNSLVAEPYPIYAFLVVIDGEVANTKQVFEIPIVARPKPSDYEFVDDKDVIEYEYLSDRIVRFEVAVNDRVDGLESNINTFEANVSSEVERLALIVDAMGSVDIDRMTGMYNRITVFNADGSVTESGDGWVKTTTFYADNTYIDETLRTTNDDGSIKVSVKRTTFNSDGSVVEQITQAYVE